MLGTLNQRIFAGVAAVNLLAPLARILRVYVYGGFDSPSATTPMNDLFALDIFPGMYPLTVAKMADSYLIYSG